MNLSIHKDNFTDENIDFLFNENKIIKSISIDINRYNLSISLNDRETEYDNFYIYRINNKELMNEEFYRFFKTLMKLDI